MSGRQGANWWHVPQRRANVLWLSFVFARARPKSATLICQSWVTNRLSVFKSLRVCFAVPDENVNRFVQSCHLSLN